MYTALHTAFAARHRRILLVIASHTSFGIHSRRISHLCTDLLNNPTSIRNLHVYPLVHCLEPSAQTPGGRVVVYSLQRIDEFGIGEGGQAAEKTTCTSSLLERSASTHRDY